MLISDLRSDVCSSYLSPDPDGASARRAQLSHRARKGGDPAAVLLHDAPQKGHAPRLVQQLDRDEQRRPRTSARHELNSKIDRDRSLARNLAELGRASWRERVYKDGAITEGTVKRKK